MKNKFKSAVLFIFIVTISFCSQGLLGSETNPSISSLIVGADAGKTSVDLSAVWDVQKYSRSIHIMAMLLVLSSLLFLVIFPGVRKID